MDGLIIKCHNDQDSTKIMFVVNHVIDLEASASRSLLYKSCDFHLEQSSYSKSPYAHLSWPPPPELLILDCRSYTTSRQGPCVFQVVANVLAMFVWYDIDSAYKLYFEIGSMGVKGSSANNNDFNQLLKEYEIVRQIDNEGLYFLKNHSTSAEYLLRQFTFNDRKEFDKNVELLEKRKSQLHGSKHLVSLERLITKSEDQYCSTFYKIYALFPFTDRTLENEIVERNIQKRKFQEKDLWSILASCILGLSHLQKNNIKHQALRSNSILISEEGVVKVYDVLTTGCQTNYDTLISKRSTHHIYLSPQLTDSLQLETGQPNCNPYKSDIFTLGIIILEAGLSNFQDECYRDECSRIHWETVQYNVHRFKQIYSQDLTSLIELMLSNQQRNRPDWVELEQRVIKQQQAKGQQKNNISFDKQSSRVSSNLQQSNANQNISLNKNQYQPYQQQQTNITQTSPFNYQPKTNNYQHLYKPTATSSFKNIIPNDMYSSSGFKGQRSGAIPAKLIPVNRSMIEPSRPLRCIFPPSSYLSTTLIDENLIVVPQDQKQETASSNNIQPNHQNGSYNPFQPRQYDFTPDIHFKAYTSYNGLSANHQQNGQPMQYKIPNINTYALNMEHQTPINSFPHTQQKIESKQSLTSNNEQGEYLIQKYKQGSEYKGYKKNGMRHGYGVFYYQDGGMYEGEWKFNKMQGRGKLFYQSGKLAYQGNWSNDQFSGEGSLHNEYPQVLNTYYDYSNLDDVDEYWTKFQGNFESDMKNGKGILFLSNSEYIEGEFKEDMVHGQATFYRLNGEKVRGRWFNNKLVS